MQTGKNPTPARISGEVFAPQRDEHGPLTAYLEAQEHGVSQLCRALSVLVASTVVLLWLCIPAIVWAVYSWAR